MAFGIGNLGNIVSEFTDSLNQIWKGGANNTSKGKGGETDLLFNYKYGGSFELDRTKWTGKYSGKPVRYGFFMIDAETLQFVEKEASNTKVGFSFTPDAYWLDIPPQALQQKEIFSTNIQATRRGVIVETEGVVFKDIIIRGTTGIFPDKRGSYSGPSATLDLTASPSPPSGVTKEKGLSTASGVKTLSGYEEFMRLRQYFLRYAYEKVQSNGNRFLVFINEKDNQELIVEPMEFIMDRNAKSPMTYSYNIVLRAVGTLGGLFQARPSKTQLSFLEKAGNIAANVSAAIKQARATIGSANRLLQGFSQAIDQTFINPLRQTQYAMEDFSDGISNALSIPRILLNNATEAVMGIRDNVSSISQSFQNFSLTGSGGLAPISTIEAQAQKSLSTITDFTKANPITSIARSTESADFNFQRATIAAIENDARINISREFIGSLKSETKELSNKLADFTNLGSGAFNAIKGRIDTSFPNPLKAVSDDEYLLLGTLDGLVSQLNKSLATNSLFASDAEKAFDDARAIFDNPNISEDQRITVTTPVNVREVIILQNDTLERIAQRELKDTTRWIELIILNKLKPPYISGTKGDGVLTFGDRILVGD